MSQNKRYLWFSTILIGVSLISLQGCDQISSLFSYFSSQKPSADKQAKKVPDITKSASTPSAGTPDQNSSSPSQAGMSANVLARVGDWQITIDEFKDRLNALKELVPEYDQSNVAQNKLILEELVRQQLLVIDAKKQGVDKQKNIVQAVEEFERTLLVREMATRVTQSVSVTDQEASDFFEENKTDFIEPAVWDISEIVVASEDEAKTILVDLYQGADFVETARQKSISASAKDGGKLSSLTELPFPKMEDVASTLEAGEISSSFKGPQGFYIIKLDGKQGGGQKEYAVVEADIKTGLTMLKQQQAILSYLADLEKKTPVEVNHKLLEK